MNKTKYRILLIGIALLISFIAGLAVKYTLTKNNITETVKMQDQLTVYTIKEYEEKIGVFTQESEIPIKTLNVYVSTLPYLDQQNLRKGIIVKGYSDLEKILEDYES